MAVDSPGLASDLRHKPSRDHSHEADWPRDLAQRKKQGAVVKPPAPAHPPAKNNEGQHKSRAPDHYAEGKKRNCNRWALVGREIFEPLSLAVEIVGQDEATEP